MRKMCSFVQLHFTDSFFEFSAHDSKNQSVWEKHLSASERSYLALSENDTNKMTLTSLLTFIFLFYIKFANFWYITCIVPNFMPIWP